MDSGSALSSRGLSSLRVSTAAMEWSSLLSVASAPCPSEKQHAEPDEGAECQDRLLKGQLGAAIRSEDRPGQRQGALHAQFSDPALAQLGGGPRGQQRGE